MEYQSQIAKTARLETAIEILAEYIGYLNSEIDAEGEKFQPNIERINALESELAILLSERRSLTPINIALINRTLYVYAPILKSISATQIAGLK